MPVRVEFDETEFRQMWLDDVRLTDLGQHFGVGYTTVSTWARKLNLPKRRAGRPAKTPEAVAREVAESGESPAVLTGGRWVGRRGVSVWVE